MLTNDNMKSIRFQDTSESLNNRINKNYQEMIDEKEPGELVDHDDLFWLIMRTFKAEIQVVLAFYILSSVIKFGSSLVILMLFESISDDDYNKAYIYSAIVVVLWYLYQLTSNAGYIDTYLLGNKIKTALSMLLYSKISKMTSFDMKNA